jgi:hypothetical protein
LLAGVRTAAILDFRGDLSLQLPHGLPWLPVSWDDGQRRPAVVINRLHFLGRVDPFFTPSSFFSAPSAASRHPVGRDGCASPSAFRVQRTNSGMFPHGRYCGPSVEQSRRTRHLHVSHSIFPRELAVPFSLAETW